MTEISIVYCDRDGRIWSVHNNAMVSSFDGRKFTSYAPEVTGHYMAGGIFAEVGNGIWLLNTDKSISLFADSRWRSWNRPVFSSVVVNTDDQIVTIDTSGVLYSYDNKSATWKPISHGPAAHRTGLTYELHASLNEENYMLKIFEAKTRQFFHAYTSTSLLVPAWVDRPDLFDALLFWSDGKVLMQYDEPNEPYLTIASTSATYLLQFRQVFRSGNNLLLYRAAPVQGTIGWELEIFSFSPSDGLIRLSNIRHANSGGGLAIDKQKHVWIGSQGGLTRVFPEITTFIEGDQNMVSGLHVINEDDRGRIWFGGYTSGLCYFDGSQLNLAPPDAHQYKRFLPGAFRDENGNMAFWTEDYGVVTHEYGTWHHSDTRAKDPFGERGYYFLSVEKGNIAAGLQDRGLVIGPAPITPEMNWSYIDESKGLLLDNILTISEDLKGRLWTGRSSQGIALYDPALDTAQTWLRSDDREKGFGALSSATDSHGNLWFGGNDGLRFLEEPHRFTMFKENLFDKTLHISMDEAGYSNVSLMAEHEGYLIFGNLHGYGFLDLKSFYNKRAQPPIFFYPTDKFLKSADQNTILIDSKGDVWIGQDLGVTRIDFDDLKLDSLPVYIIIDSVLVSGRNLPSTGLRADSAFDAGELTSVSARQTLPSLKRHLEIFMHPSFTGLLNDNVGFQHRLLHENIQDTTWSAYSKSDRIVFTYLPPGKNLIEIRAIKNNQIADSVTLNYHVPLALSENPWFWICLIGGLSIAGAIIFWRMYRQQLSIKQVRLTLKEKELALSEQEREKEQLQIKAIANALNPHFINNSLQWLQSRVRKDPEAVRMIDRFSKNIHTVFVNSRQGKAYHALREEIELVKNYIYIQKSRYGDFIDVSLPPDEVIASLSEVEVPLMQIQIHVENAIEHGLRHRPGARKLNIDIRENGAYVHIDITDDGLGRPKSAEIGSHGTQQGTDMLKSLHAIFNKHNALHILSKYVDTPFSYPETGEKYGTIVHIEIPKHYTYELTKD